MSMPGGGWLDRWYSALSGEEAEDLCGALRRSLASGRKKPPPPPHREYDPDYRKSHTQHPRRKCLTCKNQTKSRSGYCFWCEKTRGEEG